MLAPKRKRFVEEYLVDLNATQAAIRAGYSPKTARSVGQRMLTFAEVQMEIERGRIRQTERTEITADRVLAELARIAFSDHADVVVVENGIVRVRDTAGLPARVRAAISEIKQTTNLNGGSLAVKLHDKVAALRLLGDHLGLWAKDRGEGDGLPPVQPELGHDETPRV